MGAVGFCAKHNSPTNPNLTLPRKEVIMNKQKLFTDFTKRFNAQTPRLIYTHAGALCTLLGDVRLTSITCTLTAGVTAAARRSQSGYIRLESTDTNVCRRIRADALPLPYLHGWGGADILYTSTLSAGFAAEPYIRAAVIKALLRLNKAEDIGIDTSAALCERGRHAELYRALMGARRGYCTLIDGEELRPYPLPVTGTLFIVASWEAMRRRKTAPQVTQAELVRIGEARRRLKACDLDGFAAIVRGSAMEEDARHKPRSKERVLAQAMRAAEGCLFARINGSRVVALAYADAADIVIAKARSAFEREFGMLPEIAVARNG